MTPWFLFIPNDVVWTETLDDHLNRENLGGVGAELPTNMS